MTQFESKYKSKINIVVINVDQRDSAEFKRYAQIVGRTRTIPYTAWVDGHGQVLHEASSVLSEKELSEASDAALQGKKP